MDVASLNMPSPTFEYIKAYLNSPVVSHNVWNLMGKPSTAEGCG